MAFELHPQLDADCEYLGDLPLNAALLMRDHRFPWVILVPRIDSLRDFHDLPADVVTTAFAEIAAVSSVLSELGATKINVAALGNMVPQLHVHVIGRTADDEAWPGPVWNAGTVEACDMAVVEAWRDRIKNALADTLQPRQ